MTHTYLFILMGLGFCTAMAIKGAGALLAPRFRLAPIREDSHGDVRKRAAHRERF